MQEQNKLLQTSGACACLFKFVRKGVALFSPCSVSLSTPQVANCSDLLSCPHRVEAQASLGEGGPEGLVCQVELDAAEPEARMERVPASTLGYVHSAC